MIRAAAILAWDGARVPARGLPTKARAFLGPVTPPRKLAALVGADEPLELRVCWLPRLKGGPDVLVPPFATKDGKRIVFRLMKTVVFGDVLGAVYRRQPVRFLKMAL
jgi:hypothetical protein